MSASRIIRFGFASARAVATVAPMPPTPGPVMTKVFPGACVSKALTTSLTVESALN